MSMISPYMPVVGAGLGMGLGMYGGYGGISSAYYPYSSFSRYGYGAYTRPWSGSWYGAGYGAGYPYAGYAGYGYGY